MATVESVRHSIAEAEQGIAQMSTLGHLSGPSEVRRVLLDLAVALKKLVSVVQRLEESMTTK